MRSLVNNLYVFWAVLAIPALVLIATSGGQAGAVFRDAGEWAVRLLILCLLVTPLRQLFPTHTWTQWLVQRRRAIGVAVFFYAALHFACFAINKGSVEALLGTFVYPKLLLGWLALSVMLILAVTSNQFSVKKLMRRWKPLQRLVYVGALLVLAHWVMASGDDLVPLVVQIAPLAALELWRLGKFAKTSLVKAA